MQRPVAVMQKNRLTAIGRPGVHKHPLNAVACALATQLWRDGMTRVMGEPAAEEVSYR